jgi:glycosyltransferase 2 family protein
LCAGEHAAFKIAMEQRQQGVTTIADKMSLPRSDVRDRLKKSLILAVKFSITAACFWYVLRRVNLGDAARALPTIDLRWMALAILVVALQIPLLAARLQAIVNSLGRPPAYFRYLAALSVTAICMFFGQVVPGLVSEGIRIWIITQFGYSLREGVSSIALDRGVGVAVLVAYVIVILFLPSPLVTLLGYREVVLVIFCGALGIGVIALLLTPLLAPVLRRWRLTYWLGTFATDAHRVLLGRRSPLILGSTFAIHLSTIVVVWFVGRGAGISLPSLDWAVVFGVMVGVALLPISIGNWGLRELAVVSLLGAHGVAPERALLFSVCFGLIFVIVALPGAIVWLLFPLPTRNAPAAAGYGNSKPIPVEANLDS